MNEIEQKDKVHSRREWYQIGYKDATREMQEKLINAGYRNCKDKVVLTKEEWVSLQGKARASIFKEAEILRLKEELNDYKQRYASAEKRYEQLVQSSCEALEKKGKQTARGIFAKVKEYAIKCNALIWHIYTDDIQEIAQQYGVEVE